MGQSIKPRRGSIDLVGSPILKNKNWYSILKKKGKKQLKNKWPLGSKPRSFTLLKKLKRKSRVSKEQQKEPDKGIREC